MMYYDIDKDALYDLVDEEVSQAADAAYGEDGTSLYDIVVLTAKDRDTVDALLDDAIGQAVRTSSDIASLGMHTEGTGSSAADTPAIIFDVPDVEASAQAVAERITRFIVLYTCAALFNQRRAALVPEYTNRAQAALDDAVALLRKRTAPTRS